MRKLAVTVFATVAVLGVTGLATSASADDPGPIVIVDPPPLRPGADLMVRPGDRSQGFVGEDSREPGQHIDQHITQWRHAAATVKACNIGPFRRLRLHATGGGMNWKVHYFVRSHDVTQSVVAGRYHTRKLAGGECVRVQMTAKLKLHGDSYARTFKVRAIPRSGDRDVVSTTVHIDGILAVP
jgi:hypothetical protein